MTIGSIFGKERQHPDVASSWNEVGLALNARESLRPIFFSVHLHVDDPVTQNVNMKRLEIKVTIHTLYYMPGELFDGRPDVVSEDVEEAPGEEPVGTTRVRVASHSGNVALRPKIRKVGAASDLSLVELNHSSSSFITHEMDPPKLSSFMYAKLHTLCKW